MMKKLLLPFTFCLLPLLTTAGYDDSRLRSEVGEGLDIRVAHKTATAPGKMDAEGQLGYEVYRTTAVADSGIHDLFVPNNPLYIRVGGGMNLAAASDAEFDGGWAANIGFGWNTSSYVRLELDAEYADYKFDDTDISLRNMSLGGTLYFDLARRWVRSGDITVRRTFVPFIGFGVRGGHYKYTDTDSDGIYVAPVGIAGVNFMFTDDIGLDIAYRYQIFAGDHGRGISDITASIRINF